MRALIIDDERLARKRILFLLNQVPEIKVIGECSNGKTATEQINQRKPDLIFLDINMKDMNGFEVLRRITVSPKPIVIFVTAHDNYASRAFDVDAFDFLLKPYKDVRFFKTIQKVLQTSRTEADDHFEHRIQELLKVYTEKARSAPSFKIPLKQGNKTILINPDDILYIIASGYYAEVYTSSKKHVLRESLNNLEEVLDANLFFRIHRSTIVNTSHVKEIIHSEYSEIDVCMTDGKLLHISKPNKKLFLEKLGI